MSETATKRRGDTRERIQSIALERFTDQGYDQTSLREIAEELGVTKAALYYHFKSKEEILDSLLSVAYKDLDALVTWMSAEPSTRERRLEMIRRLGSITAGVPGEVMRCVQQNEVALQKLGSTTNLVHDLKTRLGDAAAPSDATVEDRLRVRIAIMTVIIAGKVGGEIPGTSAERAAAAQAIAADIIP